MSIPLIGIPILNRPDLLHRLLASIELDAAEAIAVIDNSCGNREIRAVLEYYSGWHPLKLMSPFCNMGVAWSWNHFVKSFPSADYWLIVGSDIAFAPGDLETIDATARAAPRDQAILHAHAGNAFCLLPTAVREAGLFDENIYPAYLEDCDYHRRCDLLGLKRSNIEGLGIVHGDGVFDGSCTIQSDPHLQHENNRTHAGNREYYTRKWGGDNEEERNPFPFHGPTEHPGEQVEVMTYWKWDLDRRRRQLWGAKP